jgi:hypothetical protein
MLRAWKLYDSGLLSEELTKALKTAIKSGDLGEICLASL